MISWRDEIGVAIPAAMAILGLCFVGLHPGACRVAAAVRLHRQVRRADRLVRRQPGPGMKAGVPSLAWALLVLLILSGLTTLIAMTRAGDADAVDARRAHRAARARHRDGADCVLSCCATATLTVQAEPVMRYMQATASAFTRLRDTSRASSPLHPTHCTQGGLMNRLLPFPLLSACLLAMWLLLNQTLSVGHSLLLGCRDGCCRRWTLGHGGYREPARDRLHLVSLVWSWRTSSARTLPSRASFSAADRSVTSGFLRIPIDMRNRYGLATLACIITATPGTFWVQFDPRPGC